MNQTDVKERLQNELRQWKAPRGTKVVLEVGLTYRRPPTVRMKARGLHAETRPMPRLGIEVRDSGGKTAVTFRVNPKLVHQEKDLEALANEFTQGLLDYAAVGVADDGTTPNGDETPSNGDSPEEAPAVVTPQRGRPRGSKKKLTASLMHERRQARGGHGKGPRR